MPSKKRKYNARFPAGRIKRIMRINDDIGKVALPVPVMISRALELFVSSLLNKAGDITIQKNARTLTLSHLKQSICSDGRLDFLKELVKNTPDTSDECNDVNFGEPPVSKKQIMNNEINNESDEETSDSGRVDDGTMTVERRYVLNDGCLCRGLSITFSRTAAPAVDTIAYLSTIRTLLCARRRRAADTSAGGGGGSRCPAVVQRARSAVLQSSDATAWANYLLDVLSSPADEYVGYVAVCVASEALLYRAASCTSSDRLVDGLVQLSIAAQSSEEGRAAALNVFGRALDDRDVSPGNSLRRARRRDETCKTLLLDRLHGVWPALVDAAVVGHRTAVMFELVRLWKSVFAAASATDRSRYYAALPRLEHVLYRTDTDPHVWLNTVRLLGAGLRSRLRDTTGRWDDDAAALAQRIATGVTRRRLLYFMGKTVKNGSDRGAKLVVQETVLLAMRSLRALDRATAAAAVTPDVVDCLDSYVKSSGLFATDVRCCRWLVRLTCDRDDALVECLLCALDVAGAVPAVRPLLDPFDAFAEFLACVSFDADVLLDFLMSDDENDFLTYALRVLKTACGDPRGFFRGCGNRLPDTMELLVRLRLKILRLHENRVFPYNVSPIARLIERCDRSYSEFLESRRGSRHSSSALPRECH